MHKSWIRSLRLPLDGQSNRSESGKSRRRRKTEQNSAGAMIQVERLEDRTLLTALVIDQSNLASFTQPDGRLEVTNAHLAGFDAITIESVTVNNSGSSGININVSNISLKSISIANVNVSNSADDGISISMENVTGFDSLAIDTVSVSDSGSIGIDIRVGNMSVGSLDINESVADGVRIDGITADISNGSISRSRLEGSVGVNGVLLNLDQSSADEFTVSDNTTISSATEDAVLINLNDSPLTGLHVLNNQFAPARAVGAEFLIDGDTFNQPFSLTNTSLPGSDIARVTMDIAPAGLEFDEDPVTGKPFQVVNGTDVPTGFLASVVSPTTLQLDFNTDPLSPTFGTFGSGEVFQWSIDLDIAGAQTTVFGNQLIGSTMRIEMSTGDIIDGVLVAVPGFPDAAKFVTTTGGSGGHGINLVADDSPVTDLLIGENKIQGNVQGGVQITANDSSLEGRIYENEINATGGDGVELELIDSDFFGSINGNLIGGNAGAGVRFSPREELAGVVQAATNANPIQITSNNHGLIGGETVVVQGVDGNVQANGVYQVQFVNADRFNLLGADGSQIGVDTDLYEGGGTWFIARSAGNIIGATNDTNPIVITTAEPHGLTTGDVINVQGVRGNLAANGTRTITVIDANRFSLDGVLGSGDFDNTHPDFGAIPGAVWWLGYRIDLVSGPGFGFDDNQITSNTGGGVEGDLPQGTAFDARIRRNLFQNNSGFGWRTTTVAGEFELNFGSNNAADANRFHSNNGAGIALNVLNSGEGSFQIRKNLFTSQQNDPFSTVFNGDGVNIRMEGNAGDVEATAALNISVIDGNTFGVDNLGNSGSGIAFHMQESTSIDTLNVTNNTFINNGDDGFKFFRRDDASLNTVNVEKNTLEGQGSDGFDFFAQNTTRDVLDFKINENSITNNAEYGVRIRVEADARIEANLDNNSIDFNGASGANGHHPNDGLGNTGVAGGIGLIGFQQVEVRMNLNNNRIRNNFGDGFSADAPLIVDTMRVTGTFTDNTFSNNQLTGFRQDGVAFGGYAWSGNKFENNGEDGARILDGDDLDLTGVNNTFTFNGANGLHLGRAVSAKFGDSTVAGMNKFSNNGEDGFKLTQGSGVYLLNRNRVRDIVMARNEYLSNGDTGLDAGQDPSTGNSAHGDDVVTFTTLTVTDSVFFQNGGDGLEWLSDRYSYPHPVSGIIVESTGRSGLYNALTIRDSNFKQNGARGIDVLNRGSEDVRFTLIDSTIQSNRLVGVYVMNTSSRTQTQNLSNDELNQDGSIGESPNLEMRVRDNLIQSNGNADPGTISTLPMPYPNDDLSYDGVTSDAEAGGASQIGNGLPITTRGLLARGRDDLATDKRFGTLGGLVVRVGTADSDGSILSSNPAVQLSQYGFDSLASGVRAEILYNAFDGNFGSEVYFDSFTSTVIPPQTSGGWHTDHDPDFQVNSIARDPLARFDLAFRGNSGNSLDVINGFAFYNNNEPEFKSRRTGGAIPGPPANPGHNDPAHGNTNPAGVNGWYRRKRNATLTLGADIPTGGLGLFGFEGWGTSAWRLERNWETDDFTLTDPVFGYSNFTDTVTLGSILGENDYRWDRFSLGGGEIFGAEIAADRFEDNDHFVSATDFGNADSVNELGLTIDVRDDDDYYTFVAADSGAASVTLTSNDANGGMSFRLYRVNPDGLTEEVQQGATTLVPAGGAATLNTTVVAGTRYFIQVEGTSLYGTVADYDIAIDAPADPGGGGGGGPVVPPPGGGGGGVPVVPGGLTGPLVVTTTLDTVAVNPGDGTAHDGAGEVSIRSAIMEANVQPGDDEIQIPAGVYLLTLAGINEDFSERGDLDIRDTVTIIGAGAGSTIIDAEDLDRLFDVLGGHKLRLEGVTLRDGGASEGGAVYNAGTLELIDSVVGDPVSNTDFNEAFSLGGAIYNARSVSGVLDVADPVNNPVDELTTSITLEDASAFATIPTPFLITVGSELMQVTAVQGNTLTVVRGFDGRTSYAMLAGSAINDGDLIGIIHDDATSTVLEFSDNAVDDGLSSGDVEVFFNKSDSANTIASKVAAAINTVTGLSAARVGNVVNLTGGVYSPSSTAVAHTDGEQVDVVYSGQLLVQRTTLYGNRSASRGGAIYNLGVADLYNTTISGNVAESLGGGIFNEGTLTVINGTVVNNHANSRSGGIDTGTAGAAATLGNTIVALNTTDNVDPDVRGAFTSLKSNIIGAISLDTGVPNATGFDEILDFAGTEASPQDPGILPLVVSSTLLPGSGQTWIHPLSGSSQAIDRGVNGTIEPFSTTDGRQSSRFVDFDGDHGVVVDIGAVEMFVDVPIADFTIDMTPTDPGENVVFDASATTHTNPAGHADPSTFLYEWDLDNDGAYDDAVGLIAQRSFDAFGTYLISLRVTDDNSVVDTVTHIVEVTLPQPTVIRAPFVVTSDHTPTIRWDDVGANYFLWVRRLSPDYQDQVIYEERLTTNSFTPATPLTAGWYRAWVQVYNNLGDRSVWSDPYDFQIVDANLLQPSGAIFDPTPVFTWEAIPGTANYDLWVRSLTTGEDQIIRKTDIPGRDTSFEATSDLPLGTYKAWLRATNVNGETGDWSAVSNFQIVTTTMLSPNSTMNQRPLISWTPVAGATRYDLQVIDVNTGVEIIRERSLTGTSYTPTFDLPIALYSARVRPLNDSGVVGYFSEPKRFTINPKFSPELIYPVGNVFDLTPRFSWKPVPGANRYDLWVRNLTTGQDEVIREQNLTDRVYQAVTKLDAGVYRWWVRAFSETTGLPGFWSAPADFTIPRPVVNGPIDPVTSTRFPTISWSAIPEYVQYDLWVRNLTTGEDQIIRRRDLTTNSYTASDYVADGLTSGLANGRYRVWVRAFNAAGEGTYWSVAYDFSVNLIRLNAPVLIGPSGATTNFTPNFRWNIVPGADHYEILVKELIGAGDSNQVTVLDVRNIPQPTSGTTVSFLAPTGLQPGNYRWWVRAVNSVGIADDDFSVYSSPLDFSIAANDSGAPGVTAAGQPGESTDEILPDDQLLSSISQFVVAEADLPSRTVVARSKIEIVGQSIGPDSTAIPFDQPGDVIPQLADAFMESWHAVEWWNQDVVEPEMAESVEIVAENLTGPIHSEVQLDSSEGRAMLGLALPVLGLSRFRRARDRKNRS